MHTSTPYCRFRNGNTDRTGDDRIFHGCAHSHGDAGSHGHAGADSPGTDRIIDASAGAFDTSAHRRADRKADRRADGKTDRRADGKAHRRADADAHSRGSSADRTAVHRR